MSSRKKVTNNKGKALGSGTISQSRRAKRAAIFGEPWSSSSWWQGGSSASSDWWQAREEDADNPWQQGRDQQHAGGWPADDEPAAQMPVPLTRKEAPRTPPWHAKEDTDEEMLVKAEPAEPADPAEPEEDPPTPWKLLEATVMSEPQSSSSSDDWGKLWRGAKKVKTPSGDEDIVVDEAIFEPSAPSSALLEPEAEHQAELIKRALYPKVMVDWHNCLEVRGHVDEVSLKKLLDAGVDVSILSWCYRNRAREVKTLAKGLEDAHRLSRIETTEIRTKRGGKVDLCEGWSIDVMFDDAEDICQEAYKAGMHVYPICTWKEHHDWFSEKGFQPYRSFAEAVDEFLKTYS